MPDGISGDADEVARDAAPSVPLVDGGVNDDSTDPGTAEDGALDDDDDDDDDDVSVSCVSSESVPTGARRPCVATTRVDGNDEVADEDEDEDEDEDDEEDEEDAENDEIVDGFRDDM